MFLFDPVIGSVDCMYAMHVSVWEYLNTQTSIVPRSENFCMCKGDVTRISSISHLVEVSCWCLASIETTSHTLENPFIWLTSLQLFYLSKFPTTDLCDLFVSYLKKTSIVCYIFISFTSSSVLNQLFFFLQRFGCCY